MCCDACCCLQRSWEESVGQSWNAPDCGSRPAAELLVTVTSASCSSRTLFPPVDAARRHSAGSKAVAVALKMSPCLQSLGLGDRTGTTFPHRRSHPSRSSGVGASGVRSTAFVLMILKMFHLSGGEASSLVKSHSRGFLNHTMRGCGFGLM